MLSCRRTVQPMQAAGAGLPRATMPKLDELRHPLLGDAPTLQLMPPPTDVPGACRAMSVCKAATTGAGTGGASGGRAASGSCVLMQPELAESKTWLRYTNI